MEKTLDAQENRRWQVGHFSAAAQLKPAPAGQRQHEGFSFLDFPGEIRNMIYRYALDMPRTRQPYSKQDGRDQEKKADTSFHLMCLCRQVGYEAGHLFINENTAYIPITNQMDPKRRYRQLVSDGELALSPYYATIIAALTDVKDLHLHLHASKNKDRQSYDYNLLLNLLQTLQHISFPSTLKIFRWRGERRKVLVHLDRFFIDDWPESLRFRSCRLTNIVVQMGKNSNVDWDLVYYVEAGSTESSGPSEPSSSEFPKLQLHGRRYPNINIRHEVCEKNV